MTSTDFEELPSRGVDRVGRNGLGMDMANLKSKKLRICFAASSGGHYEQLLMLMPLMKKYESFIITEKTGYDVETNNMETYCLRQISRKEKFWLFKFIANSAQSLFIFLRKRPDAVICTGVLSMIPICLISKLFKRKLIYIESFAKVTSPTLSGKFLYQFADIFFVQWESMLEIFPKAVYRGSIY